MKDKHVNPLLKSMGLLSACILGLNVSLSATRSVKKKKINLQVWLSVMSIGR